tara:strand:+ start:89 stop:316 length:228 start_codon:yes stop_codon:yes gene_type:complete
MTQPAGLGDWVIRIPFRLNVDGANDLESSGVPGVVFREVVPSDRGVISVTKWHKRVITKPRIIVCVEIPEMLMSV